jgi:hypothetical protein
MGSIPPAASIEYDQREIVAVIKWAYDNGYRDYASQLCAAPSNADLTQLLKAIFGIMNSTRLTTPKTYYVNGALGDDGNAGTSPGAGAFKTLQRAANETVRYNLNGFNVAVYVADGTYAKVVLPVVNGSGGIWFIGNLTTPANCVIHANVGPAIQSNGGTYYVSGFRLESDARDPLGAPGVGLWAFPNAYIRCGLGDVGAVMEFGPCADGHLWGSSATLSIDGTIRIMGDAPYHMYADTACYMHHTWGGAVPVPTIVVPSTRTFSQAFCCAQTNASMYPTFNISAGDKGRVVGQRYAVALNAVMYTGAGALYLPGTIAGTTATGGQYV